jgi:hypothetical protein
MIAEVSGRAQAWLDVCVVGEASDREALVVSRIIMS